LLSPLDYPFAKPDGAVNSGRSPFILLWTNMCCIFLFFNSIPTSTTDSINAEKSATGPASNTPIIPKRSGSSRVSGIKKKVCLVNANRAPFNAFPIAVKKLEESNCTPFTNTMKR